MHLKEIRRPRVTMSKPEETTLESSSQPSWIRRFQHRKLISSSDIKLEWGTQLWGWKGHEMKTTASCKMAPEHAEHEANGNKPVKVETNGKWNSKLQREHAKLGLRTSRYKMKTWDKDTWLRH
jgi:hypothetical protein